MEQIQRKLQSKWWVVILHFLLLFLLVLVTACAEEPEESLTLLSPSPASTLNANQQEELTSAEVKNFPSPRVYHTMVFDNNRHVVILFGGLSSLESTQSNSENEQFDHLYNDTWEYNGASWHPVEPSLSPPARYGHGMVFDSNRAVTVLYGGTASSTQRHADTWEYDGETWLLVNNFSETPGGREFPIMIFDPSQQLTFLLVGGMLDDMWAYNGEFWLKTPVHVPPPIRFAITTKGVFDSERQVLILHEGSNTGWGDTHVLIGNEWEPVATRGDEGGRGLFDLVFDKARGVIVLFGGELCERQEANTEYHCDPLNDTWEYDGKQWHLIDVPVSPPARYGHAMAYDEVRNVVVLFGGVGVEGQTLNDTWEYDGVTWVQR